MKPEDLITDKAIEIVFENTNFGGQSHRDVINKNLQQINEGYSIGNTAKCCLSELGLIEIIGYRKYEITKLGKEYLSTL